LTATEIGRLLQTFDLSKTAFFFYVIEIFYQKNPETIQSLETVPETNAFSL